VCNRFAASCAWACNASAREVVLPSWPVSCSSFGVVAQGGEGGDIPPTAVHRGRGDEQDPSGGGVVFIGASSSSGEHVAQRIGHPEFCDGPSNGLGVGIQQPTGLIVENLHDAGVIDDHQAFAHPCSTAS
jgi:hypothetical protein